MDITVQRMNAIETLRAELLRKNPAESVLWCARKVISITENCATTAASWGVPGEGSTPLGYIENESENNGHGGA